MSLRSTCLIVLALLASPPALRAGDVYFMTVYGAQRPVINQPRYTHTWATFIRLSGEGCELRQYTAQAFTISWLPATLKVRPSAIHPEPGVNLTLQKTLEWCAANRMETKQLGPYQISQDLWNLAFRRFDQLESGGMQYRASDLFNAGRSGGVCNCIYSVLDLEGRDPAFRPVTLGFGDLGSWFVARRLTPYIVNRRVTYPWVSDMIGVRNFPQVGLLDLLDR
jgi:hypothetical protein